jgi:hypothetical protein
LHLVRRLTLLVWMVRVCLWHVGVMVKMTVPMALMSETVVRFLQTVLAISCHHLLTVVLKVVKSSDWLL